MKTIAVTIGEAAGDQVDDRAELVRERDAARAAAADERERNISAMQQCDRLAAELLAWKRRHGEAEARAAYATETIRHMERSLFWRARLICLRVRSSFRFWGSGRSSN